MSQNVLLFVKNVDEVLKKVAQIPGAKSSHGEASFGYSFELKNGNILTIGQTDDDASDSHLFWIKSYTP